MWPEVLRSLVQTYGAAAVNEAGLQTLGYPGICGLEQFEVKAMQNYLMKVSPQ
jgi:hypothetical protein